MEYNEETSDQANQKGYSLIENKKPTGPIYMNIKMKAGFNYKQLLTIPLAYFIPSLLTNYQPIIFQFILLSPNLYNVPQESLGTINADIIFWSQLGQLLTTVFFGQLYDTWGRRKTLTFTCLMMTLCMVLQIPIAPSLILLTIVNVVSAICLNGPFCSPLIADCLRKESRGKGSAIQEIGYASGTLFASTIVFWATQKTSYFFALVVCACFAIAFIILQALFIREPDTEHLKLLGTNQQNLFDITLWKDVKRALRERLPLAVCVIGSFLMRNASIITSTYIMIWMTTKLDDATEIQTIFAVVNALAVVLQLIVSYPFGLLCDATKSSFHIPMSYLFRCAGIIGFLTVDDPRSFGFLAFFSLIELGNAMENISVEQTYARHLLKEIRGCLNSVQYLSTSIGLMTVALITGRLYDQVGYWVPFVIIGGFDFAFAMFVVMLWLLGYYKD